MAFIGSDGLERQLKQLKQQLCDKDAQLTSMQNEQRKKGELLDEAKREKQAAQYKLQEEADRALKAETALQTKTSELAKFRMQLDNLQSSLINANEKLKSGDKDKQRLQYEIDLLSAGDAAGIAKKLQDDKEGLQKRIGELETALKRAETESKQAHAASSSRSAKLAPSPVIKSRGGRRRASSTGATSRIQELEAEVASLRAAVDPSTAEVDTLRDQLATARRERERAENGKIAAEKALRKELEEAKSKLEDVEDEVRWWRQNEAGSGAVGKGELEKMRKDVDRLGRELESKDKEVKKRDGVVGDLERRIMELHGLEEELARERDLRLELERAALATPAVDEPKYAEEILALNKQIANLEADLAEAKARPVPASTTSGSSTNDRQFRQLQRDLKAVQAQKNSLEASLQESDDLLAEREEEIRKLKCGIPLPPSPSLSPKPDHAGVERLEDRVRELEEEVAREREERDSVQRDLAEMEERLQSVTLELASEKRKFEKFKGDVKTFTSQRNGLEADLKQARADLTIRDERVADLERSVSKYRQDAEAVEAIRTRVEELSSDLAAKDALLASAIKEGEDLRAVLSSRTHDDAEFESLVQQLVEQTEQVATLQKERELLDFGLAQDKKALEEQVEQLKMANEAIEGRLEETLQRSEAMKKANEETIQSLAEEVDEQRATASTLQIQLSKKSSALAKQSSVIEDLESRLETATTDIARLEKTVSDLQEQMGDRSTESEARAKDEELFQLKEDIAGATQQLVTAQEQVRMLGEMHEQASQRAATLETQLADARADVSPRKRAHDADTRREIGRLEAKIGQLRNERDELRTQLSFVKHENHFAVRAAEAGRAGAVEELQRVRGALKTKESEVERVLGEMRVTSERLGAAIHEAEERSSQDKADIIQARGQAAELESQLEAARAAGAEDKKWIEHMMHEKAKAQAELSKVQQALFQARAAVKELEARVDGLKTRLGEDEEKKDVVADGLQEARSRTSSRASRHSRTRSELASAGGVEEMMADKVDMIKRVQRRDQTIESLRREIKGLQLKLGANDMTEEVEQLAQEKNELNVLLSEKVEQLDLARTELRDARKTMEGQADALVAAHGQARQQDSIVADLMAGERGLVLAVLVQRQVVSQATQRWKIAAGGLRHAKEIIAKLDTEGKELRATEAAVSTRLNELESAKAEVETELMKSRANLQDANREVAALRTELETALVAAASSESMSARVAYLESSLAEATSRAETAEAEVGTLLDKLASAEKARTSADSAAQRAEEVEEQIKEAEEKVKKLESELQALLAELAEGERAHDEALQEVEARASSKVEEHRGLVDGASQRAIEGERLAEERQARVGELVSQVAELEGQVKLGEEKRDAIGGQMKGLEARLAAADEASGSLRVNVDTITSQYDKTVQMLQATKAELEAAKALEAEVDTLRVRIGELAMEGEQKDEESKRLSEALDGAQAELGNMRRLVALSEEKASAHQAELAHLTQANEQLRAELHSAASKPASTADAQELADLQERIQELEASLTLKVQEVDEADDRVREKYKENAKLEKKVAKLQRQLAAAAAAPPSVSVDKETAANTAANRSIAAPPPSIAASSMPPPPLPSSIAAKAPTPQRQALKAVNVFDSGAPPTPSTAGLKRHREEDDKPAGLEHIMLPPSFAVAPMRKASATGANRTAFTPQRSNAFAPKQVIPVAGSEGKPDEVFNKADVVKAVTPGTKNIFARPSVAAVGAENVLSLGQQRPRSAMFAPPA